MYFNELQPTILIKPIWNYSSTAVCATAIFALISGTYSRSVSGE